MVEICDYEGSEYRTEFWRGREYEDLAERIALGKLLPPRGERLIEIGAGFGRLADLYRGYREVVLLDYAKSMLREAQARLGQGGRFIYVAADLYNLPFGDSLFDTAVTVRVLHHIQDLPTALGEIKRILRPNGTYVLEYANKRNLKRIIRFLLGCERHNPFSHEPLEFLKLNYNFHPAFMERHLREVGFTLQRQLSVSTFRLPLFKRLLDAKTLAFLDGLLQGPMAPLKLAPSIFVKTTVSKARVEPTSFWRCPGCHHSPLSQRGAILECRSCGARWGVEGGIYDFKEPLSRKEP